ncbi:lipoyltransferase [Pisolithus sp. B1]|nr:lipoyltransferase [Pisolithus sp. B1]
MSLPPVFYHYFRTPLPYARTLALQERLHQIQLATRHTSSHHDVLLLLQHRPLVGYPILDLGRTSPAMGTRDYVCRIQRAIQAYLAEEHGLRTVPSEHMGLFLDATTKVASIGVQVRHGLTTHGFAMNVTKEPLAWFDRVVACGLADVKAGCIELATGKAVQVDDVVEGIVAAFGTMYGRGMERLSVESAGEVGEAIVAVEEEALAAGDWPKSPATLSP